MKKLLSLVLTLLLVLAFAGSALAFEPVPAEEIKVGFVYIGDPSDKGYTLAHHQGTLAMQEALGLRDDQILIKTFVTEDSACEDAILELIEQGCHVIFGNSFGFGTYMAELAELGPEDPVFISHGDCIGDVEYLKGLVGEKFPGHEIVVSYIGPVIGTHSGAGTLALFFKGKKR